MTRPLFYIVEPVPCQPGTEESAPKEFKVYPYRLSIGNKLLVVVCAMLAAYIIGTAVVALWKIL